MRIQTSSNWSAWICLEGFPSEDYFWVSKPPVESYSKSQKGRSASTRTEPSNVKDSMVRNERNLQSTVHELVHILEAREIKNFPQRTNPKVIEWQIQVGDGVGQGFNIWQIRNEVSLQQNIQIRASVIWGLEISKSLQSAVCSGSAHSLQTHSAHFTPQKVLMTRKTYN